MSGLTAEERERVALALPSVAARAPDVERVIGVVERIIAARESAERERMRETNLRGPHGDGPSEEEGS